VGAFEGNELHNKGLIAVGKHKFFIKAIWDEESKVFVSESNIVGLHIEAQTLAEFEDIMHANALELVIANHIKPSDMAKKKLSELIPTIFWQAPNHGGAVAA